MGASLESIDVIEVGCIEGTEMWISDGMVLGTTLVTYDSTDIGLA